MFKDDLVLEVCKGKSVLHFGASDYPYHKERFFNKHLLHYKLSKVTSYLLGVDNNVESVKFLNSHGLNNIVVGDVVLNKYDERVYSHKYDVVLLLDILEHLTNPGLALQNIKQFCDENTIILVSVPNVWSVFRLKNHFRKEEIVHPDHCFWPSKHTMEVLLKKSGFGIVNEFFALSGSSCEKHTLLGRLFDKLILHNFPFMYSKLIFSIKKYSKFIR